MGPVAVVVGARAAGGLPRATQPPWPSELDEALQVDDGPTLLRFPKGYGCRIRCRRSDRIDGIDVLARPAAGCTTMCCWWPSAPSVRSLVDVAARLADQGIGVTVVDPRWVLPVPAALVRLAAGHELVVTVEDGGRQGGVGAAVTDAWPHRARRQGFRAAAGVPGAGSRAELLADLGLTAQPIARWITEQVSRRQTSHPPTEHPQ